MPLIPSVADHSMISLCCLNMLQYLHLIPSGLTPKSHRTSLACTSHCSDAIWLLTHWPLWYLNEILDVIFILILVIDGWGIPCEIALIWMSLDFTDDQLTLVQVMAWCRQATSHYLSQCWPRSLSPYGVTRPQSVNLISLAKVQNKYTILPTYEL